MGFSINFSKNTEDIIDDKLKSPFWKNFILGWITWNWKVWYVTFFVNGSVSGNKIDYIKNMYTYFDFYSIFPCLGLIVNWLIVPGIVSYLMVYQLPKRLTDKFIKEEQANKQRKNIAIEEGIKSDTKVLKAQKENIVVKEKIKNTEIENKHIKWDKEYGDFKKNTPKSFLNLLDILGELIYTHSGFYKDNRNLFIDSNSLRKLDLYDLIEIKNEEYKSKITEKGKYFLKKHSLENVDINDLPF